MGERDLNKNAYLTSTVAFPVFSYIIWQVNTSSVFCLCLLPKFTALRCQEDCSVHILCRKDRRDASSVFLTWHQCI